MKQKFFLSLLAITFTVLSASAENPERLIINAGNVEHLSIQDDVDIVLLPGAKDENAVILDQNASDQLNLRLSNKKLVISAQRHHSKNKRLTVYVYVNKLKTITVEGDSQVKTIGSLDTGKLDVFIDGDAQVHLITNGVIKAHALNDSSIDVKYLSGNSLAKRAY